MKRILLVDDDESNRLTLSVLLEDEHFDVTVARSRADAERVLDAGARFDAVLLDHSLGDGYGGDLVPLIRARMPAAKIVALSGSSDLGVLMQADLTLLKGLHFEDFLQRLRAAGV